MNANEKEICYEQKIKDISQLMEELVLEAFLVALQKIKHRNKQFLNFIENEFIDTIKF